VVRCLLRQPNKANYCRISLEANQIKPKKWKDFSLFGKER